MTDELITNEESLQIAIPNFVNDKNIANLMGANQYLPYIQVMGSNSNDVKTGKQPIGTFTITSRRNSQNLGKSFSCVLLGYRPKAMIFTPSPIAYYKPNTAAFEQIVQTADVPNSGKGYGLEFLLWIPSQQQYAQYFFSNKTARNEAAGVVAAMNQRKLAATFVVELIDDPKNKRSWHAGIYHTSDVQPESFGDSRLQEVMHSFQNPPESEIEPVEPAQGQPAVG